MAYTIRKTFGPTATGLAAQITCTVVPGTGVIVGTFIESVVTGCYYVDITISVKQDYALFFSDNQASPAKGVDAILASEIGDPSFAITGDDLQQLSQLSLTITNYDNVVGGKLYPEFWYNAEVDPVFVHLNIYKKVGGVFYLVCAGLGGGADTVTLAETNNSGISGSVYLAYAQDVIVSDAVYITIPPYIVTLDDVLAIATQSQSTAEAARIAAAAVEGRLDSTSDKLATTATVPTGMATADAVAEKILQTPANKIDTDANGKVVTSNPATVLSITTEQTNISEG